MSNIACEKCIRIWYRLPKVKWVLRPLHCNWRRENWMAPVLDENHSKHSQTSGYRYVHLTPWIRTFRPVTLRMSLRPFQVIKDHQQFFDNSFRASTVTECLAWVKLERCNHLGCVQFDYTNRLICDRTFFISSWPWPAVKFSLWPLNTRTDRLQGGYPSPRLERFFRSLLEKRVAQHRQI